MSKVSLVVAELIKPAALKPGDLVQVIAPASHFDQDRFEAGLRILADTLDVRTTYDSDVFSKEQFLAGGDARRTAELQSAFANPEVRGIFCARGGYGSARILNLLDVQTIRSNPKIFVGYSDITSLHLWFQHVIGLVTFHGPMVTGNMSHGLDDFDANSMRETLMKTDAAGTLVGRSTESLNRGRVTGTLTGGSLSLVASSIGTPWQPETKGCILFLEDVGEPPYRVDRMLRHLRDAGLLQDIAGLAFGDFHKCENSRTPEIACIDILREFAQLVGVPAVSGLPFGHGSQNRTVPYGVEAELDGDLAELTILAGAVS